ARDAGTGAAAPRHDHLDLAGLRPAQPPHAERQPRLPVQPDAGRVGAAPDAGLGHAAGYCPTVKRTLGGAAGGTFGLRRANGPVASPLPDGRVSASTARTASMTVWGHAGSAWVSRCIARSVPAARWLLWPSGALSGLKTSTL